MIRSVSMSSPSTGTARPEIYWMGARDILVLGEYFAGIADFTRDRRRCDHDRAHEQSSAGGATLAAFEVSVRGGGADLVPHQLIGVHAQAHGATGFAPVKSCLSENLIDSHFCTDFTDSLRARDSDGPDSLSHLPALEKFRGFDKVGHAGVGAGAEEGDLNLLPGQFLPSLKLHEFKRFFGGGAVGLRKRFG